PAAPATGPVLPRRFHGARPPLPADAAQPAAALSPALPGGLGYAAEPLRRPPPPGGPGRHHGAAAYLGSEPAVPPAPALRRHRPRPVGGRTALGRRQAPLLPADQGAGPAVPREVPGRPPRRLPGRPAVPGRRRGGAGRPRDIPPMARRL